MIIIIIRFEDFIIIIFIIGLVYLSILKFKINKSNSYLLFALLFYVYISLLLKYTQFPIEYIPEFSDRALVLENINYIPFARIDYVHGLLNMVMTIPFGFLLPFIHRTNFKKIFLWSILLPTTIELLQLLSSLATGRLIRITDINDVIFNFFGVLMGYVMYKGFKTLFLKLTSDDDNEYSPLIQFIRQV